MRKWIYPLALLPLLIAALPYFCSYPPLKSVFLSIVGGNVHMSVSAKKLELSWLGPQKFYDLTLMSPDVDGSIQSVVSDVPFWSLSNMSRALVLEGGSFQIHPANGPRAEITQIHARVRGALIEMSGATQEEGQTGEFSLQGEAVNPSLEKTDINVTFNATRMPSAFIDRIANFKGMFTAAVGPTFDCSAKTIVQKSAGSIDFQFSGDNAEANGAVEFDPDSFTLKKPLQISFQLTAALSQTLLKDVSPLFLTGVQSKTPVVLQISPVQFLWPRPFSLSKLRMEQGVLDLGQARIENGPSLTSLIRLLKADSLTNLRTMNAWFTPVIFSIRQGILYARRMDFLLADTIHLCSWGKADLVNDKLDMYLGLPADTLASTFGLQNIPLNYVMKIPIEGSSSSPDIQTGPATAKIAALIAAQKIPRKKNPVGGIFHLFAPSLLDDSKDVPPPRRPYPWERSQE